MRARRKWIAVMALAALLLPAAWAAWSGEPVYENARQDGENELQYRDPQAFFRSQEASKNIGNDLPAAKDSVFSAESASDNNITVNAGPGTTGRPDAAIAGHIFGGIAANEDNAVSAAHAAGNTVNVTNQAGNGGARGQIGLGAGNGNITGGWTWRGKTTGNTVNVDNVTVLGNIYGGWKRGGGYAAGDNVVASGNAVNIGDNVELRDTVYGAYSQGTSGGVLHGNSVVINDTSANSDIRSGIIAGAYSALSPHTIDGNSVTVADGNITDTTLYGGRGQSSSTITGNEVTIAGGTITNPYSYSVIVTDETYGIVGGQNAGGNGQVEGNSVTITGGDIFSAVYGGQSTRNTNINNVQVVGNSVTVSGGTVEGEIYGGFAYRSSTKENTVTITGGSVISNIIGGYADGSATGNTVEITGGTLTSNGIIGGEAYYGNATGNTVTIDGTVTFQASLDHPDVDKPNLLGGLSVSGQGDAFTGNKLEKNSAVSVASAQNFETVAFGYDGNAGIDVLNTTASGVVNPGGRGVTVEVGMGDTITFDGELVGTGSLTKADSGTLVVAGDANRVSNSAGVTVSGGALQIGNGGGTGGINTSLYTVENGATLAYNRDDSVTFNGTITGDGTLRQTGGTSGTGTLILTGNNNAAGAVEVAHGTLQIGNDNGAGGDIISSGGFNLVNDDSVLAYDLGVDREASQKITGAGKLVQRGTGTLTVSGTGNDFTGGTEIESGTLRIGGGTALNKAIGRTTYTSQGYVTFTGADTNGAKRIVLGEPDGNVFALTNSFRAASGTDNHIDLTSSVPVNITGTDIAGEGGAFYVASGAAMSVTASQLNLFGNKANNGTSSNDLYVESGGAFTLYSGGNINFVSGINGEGTLTLGGTLMPSGATPASPALVSILGNNQNNTFKMGTTRVVGESGRTPVALDLLRMSPAHNRVVFENDLFEITGGGDYTAALRGDGIVEAGTITGKSGAVLNPINAADGNDTLTLRSDNVSLTDFGLIYGVNTVPDVTQQKLASDAGGVPTSNNSLLYIDSGNNAAVLDNGTVAVVTRGNVSSIFDHGSYLVVKSTEGFETIDGKTIDNGDTIGNVDVNDVLKLQIGSSLITVSDENDETGPRGGFFGFEVGGDPLRDATSNTDADPSTPNIGPGDTNIWLTHNLNSLSMELNSDMLDWSGDSLLSLQMDDDKREDTFMSGDKLYVTGDGALTIALPEPDILNPSIAASGLVVGHAIDPASTEVYDDGTYVFTGAGRITTDAHAGGKYVAASADTAEKLDPTHKLEKYGESTLTFLNTGGNLFTAGIDLHGGTTQFTQANQIDDNGTTTSFLDDATLELLDSGAGEAVTLDNNVAIASGVTGDFSVRGNAVLEYVGTLSGADDTAVFKKSESGTMRLAADSSFAGAVDVDGGTLRVDSDYGSTKEFNVASAATLSGTGRIGMTGGDGTVSGTLMPGNRDSDDDASFGSLEINMAVGERLIFESGSVFNIRIKDSDTNDSITLIGGSGGVEIRDGATVFADFDFWGSDIATNTTGWAIIHNGSSAGYDEDADIFDVMHNLPRGWDLIDEWRADDNWLLLQRIPNGGYGHIPDGSHNENEIGDNLDRFPGNNPGGITDIIDRLDGDDETVRKLLDQLTGDLTPNAFFLALKEPWRHPFNRMAFDDPSLCAPAAAPRIWAEFTSRYERVDYDGNAHGSRVRRNGIALGIDRLFSPGMIGGATFQYSNPRLRQDTGEADVDDFEFGLYGMALLPAGIEAKAYLGYSHQSYDFRRTVSLPGTTTPSPLPPLHERLDGRAGGNALSASIEAARPFQVLPALRLLPVAAVDFERAWMNGYRESGGSAALEYDDSSMTRVTLRAGLSGELALRDRLALKARAQYGRHVAGQRQPSTGVRFANEDPAQPTADIWGSRIGRDYLNLGVGGEWKAGSRDNLSLYVNYDAKLYRRATVHAGEAGVSIAF